MSRWKNRLRGRLIEGFLGTAPAATRAVSKLRHGSKLTLFVAVDDPYSYLLAQLLPKLVEATDAKLRVRLVGQPSGDLDPAPALRRAYGPRDAARLARYLDVEFPASPVELSAEHIELAQAVLAAERDPLEELDVFRTVGEALWSGDGAALRAAGAAFGSAQAAEVEEVIAANGARLKRMGHFLPGMLHHEGQWYWGVDRLPLLAEALGAEGYELPRRAEVDDPPGDIERDDEGRPILDFWFSFRSPYSYLAIERTFEIAERHNLAVRVRPVLPMVMRGLSVPRVKRLYIVLDTAREAKRLGIPFGSIIDPLGPGIARCLSIWPVAEAAGVGPEYLLSAGRGIWSEALDVAHDNDLRVIVERAGMSWDDVADVVATAGEEGAPWEARAAAEREELLAAGMWGVPCYRLGTHCLWGQDRLWMLDEIAGRIPPS